MATEIGHHRLGLGLADPAGQRRRGGTGQCGKVGQVLAERRLLLPETFTLPRLGIGGAEAADAEGERPAVLGRQCAEARHGGALHPLPDHLIECEEAALAGAVAVGEGDRRRVERRRGGAVGMAGRTVAGGAALGIEGLPRAGSGTAAGAKGTG